MTARPAPRDVARKYAAAGLAAIPLEPGGKRAILKRWQHRATTDADDAAALFSEAPDDANVGIICGAVSGIVVIDIDGATGAASWAEACAEHGVVVTREVATPRGRHLYFRHPGIPIRNAVGLLPGVDARGDRGYVVAPPSVVGGHVYTWAEHPDGLRGRDAFAPLPDWLVSRLRADGGRKEAAPAGEGEESGSGRAAPVDGGLSGAATDIIPRGRRHHALVAVAGFMRRYGLPLGAIEAAVEAIASRACEAPDDPALRRDVRHTIESAGQWSPEMPVDAAPAPGAGAGTIPEGTPTIEVRAPAPAVLDAAWSVMSSACRLYRRAALLVELADGALRPLTRDAVMARLVRLANWTRTTAKGEPKPTMPPTQIATAIAGDPSGRVPEVRRTMTAPVVTMSGQLIEREHYDKQTGTLVFAPASPSGAEPLRDGDELALDVARWTIDALLEGFEFATGEARATCVAAMLTLVTRPLFSGPVPMILITASRIGTGKTTLARLLCAAVRGVEPDVVPARDDAVEQQKTIDAMLLAGGDLLLLDNVSRLEGDTLAALLTSPTASIRPLGRSDIVRVDGPPMIVATGNNPVMPDEMARRAIEVRLTTTAARPTREREFARPDPVAWAVEHRRDVMSALLTLLVGWHEAGRPAPRGGLGGFPGWARVVGGIMTWSGLWDRVPEAEPRSLVEEELHAVLMHWWVERGGRPASASELARMARSGADGKSLAPTMLGDMRDEGAARSLGKRLHRHEGAVFDLGGARVRLVKATGRLGTTGRRGWELRPEDDDGGTGQVLPFASDSADGD